jgi:hypothetical protein
MKENIGFCVSAHRYHGQVLISFHETKQSAVAALATTIDCDALCVIPGKVVYASNGNVRYWEAFGWRHRSSPNDTKSVYRFGYSLPVRRGDPKGMHAFAGYFNLALTQGEFEDYQYKRSEVHTALTALDVPSEHQVPWYEAPEVADGLIERLRLAVNADAGTQFLAYYPHSGNHRNYPQIDLDGQVYRYNAVNGGFIDFAPESYPPDKN